jgi:peptidoglycan hydrolase-like protein with peptidoglycan-binding domain
MKITSNAGMSIMFATLLSIGLTSSALAYYPIQSQLDFGETNADVTNLQTFFKDNPAIYPEGIVSGYFGSLTRSSVQRFQAQYGLDQVGRV